MKNCNYVGVSISLELSVCMCKLNQLFIDFTHTSVTTVTIMIVCAILSLVRTMLNSIF